jgi:integrase
MKAITPFMLELVETLKNKETPVTDSTATVYLRTLYILNGDKSFKNLAFLKNFDIIQNKINELAESTQKNYYSAIASVLSLYKEKAAYKKTYNHWYDKMMAAAKGSRDKDSSEKTEKQDKNWIEWKEVINVKNDLIKKVHLFAHNKLITAQQYDLILQLLILSLYTDVPPRRNQDYQQMYVVKQWDEKQPTDRNYLDYDGKQFVFNVYKTAKTHGQYKLAITPELLKVIDIYLKHHPNHKGAKKFAPSFAFLVTADGSALTAVNAITRILNRIFGKNIAASMLRHIYLSDKYDVKEMQKDANAMGHTITEQRSYLKGSGGGEFGLEITEVEE